MPYDMHTKECTCLKIASWAQKIPQCESCRSIRSVVLRVADSAGWGQEHQDVALMSLVIISLFMKVI
jgi:hypothetical protein